MKKELWVGIGVGGALAGFALIVGVIIQMSQPKPSYSKVAAYTILACGGGFFAGSLGAFWALSGDNSQNAHLALSKPVGDRDSVLPQPVDALKLLGETPEDQWSTIARHCAASYPTPPRELSGLLDRVRAVGQPTMAQQVPLPTPIAQAEPPAIPMPSYEHPPVERVAPRPVKPALHGEDQEEDFWSTVPDRQLDSMSVFDGALAEDVFS